MHKRTLLATVPFAALLLLSACGTGDHAQNDKLMADQRALVAGDSTDKANVASQEATARKLLELSSAPDSASLGAIVADNFVEHQMPDFITTQGLAGLKQEMAAYYTAFPDMKQEVLGMATNGDRTYVQLHITGTNSGAWGTMPATGKKMDVMGCDILRFENGKAVEHWGYMEEEKMMQQLGLMPAPGAAPAKAAKKK